MLREFRLDDGDDALALGDELAVDRRVQAGRPRRRHRRHQGPRLRRRDEAPRLQRLSRQPRHARVLPPRRLDRQPLVSRAACSRASAWPGSYGTDRVTTQNLEVVAVRADRAPAARPRRGARARAAASSCVRPAVKAAKPWLSPRTFRSSPRPRSRPARSRCRPACSPARCARHLLYEVVKMQRANRRAGTRVDQDARRSSAAAARSRGGRRAPAAPAPAASRSPLWVGGATIFGPQPRDYSYRLPAQRAPQRAALGAGAEGARRAARRWSTRSSSPTARRSASSQMLDGARRRRSALIVTAAANPTARARGAQPARRQGAARRGRQRLRRPALPAPRADARGGRRR